MGREADAVFECLKPEAERRGIGKIHLWLSFSGPELSEGSTGFAYDLEEDGSWSGTRRYEYLSALSNADASEGLSEDERERIRRAVSAIPVLGPLADLRAMNVCVEAAAGTIPDRLHANFDDGSFGRDDARQFQSIANWLRREADRAGIGAIEILSGDDGPQRSMRLTRKPDGTWSELLEVVSEPVAEPQPSANATLPFQACVFRSPEGQLSLLVGYRSRLPRNGVSRFALEANRVFDVVRGEAERRGVVSVLVSPRDARGFSSGLAYHREDGGGWSRPFDDVPQEAKRELAEGPPLKEEELEQIRQSVSAVPDPATFPDIPQVVYCTAGDTGFIADRLTAEYPDSTFWKGERQQFESIVRGLRKQAEEAGLGEIRITVRGDGLSHDVRQIRGPDGSWKVAVGRP